MKLGPSSSEPGSGAEEAKDPYSGPWEPEGMMVSGSPVTNLLLSLSVLQPQPSRSPGSWMKMDLRMSEDAPGRGSTLCVCTCVTLV
jgi:hypothetical protein